MTKKLTASEALCESALRHLAILEAEDFRDVVISAKASRVAETLTAYRLLAERTDCPLHLGVTEAGTERMGLIKSSAGLGALLVDGIGDTMRVSLSDDVIKEVTKGVQAKIGMDKLSGALGGLKNILGK